MSKLGDLYIRVNEIYYELLEEMEERDTKNWHEEAKRYNTDLNVVIAFVRALLVEIKYMYDEYENEEQEGEEDDNR